MTGHAQAGSGVPNLGVTMGQLVDVLGGELHGDRDGLISAVGPLDTPNDGVIAFLSNPKYRLQLSTARAVCVIVSPAVKDEAVARGAAIVTDDPYLYFAKLTQWWAAHTRPRPAAGVHPSAVVDPSAVLGHGVTVGPLAVVESGVVLGDDVIVGRTLSSVPGRALVHKLAWPHKSQLALIA